MKKFTLFLMLLLICTGCGHKEVEIESSTSIEFESEIVSELIESESEIVIESETEEMSKEELCQEFLESTEVKVLSSTVVDYEKAKMNGYGVYSEDYDKATILTLSVKFPPKGSRYDYYENLEIVDKEGNETLSVWNSWTNRDGLYHIYIVRVAGEIDLLNHNICLEGKIDGVSVNKPFGEVIGFDEAKEILKDDYSSTGSSVVKLQGRHYFISEIRSITSGIKGSTSTDIKTFSESETIILVPLEGGFDVTLDKDKIKLNYPEINEKTYGELVVNNPDIEERGLNCGTNITIFVLRDETEANLHGDNSEEIYNQIDSDQETFLQSATVSMDDGDGNEITLRVYSYEQSW